MICQRCGTKNEPSYKFCFECGNFLQQGRTNERLLLALDYERQGEPDQAVRQLKAVIDSEPKNAHAQKLLGNVYFHMGLLDWAINAYQAAVSQDQEYIDAFYDLGVALYHRARVAEAIESFEKVLDLNPEYHAAHYRLGVCYHHIGNLDKAIEHFTNSLMLTPEYVMAHYHLGVMYLKREANLKKAADEFKKVLEEAPSDAASAAYLADIYEKLGDKKLAAFYRKETLAIKGKSV